MNIEVEIKVRIDNFNEVKKKVSSIGTLLKAVKQIDDYYVPWHRDFFAHKPEPVEFLRIRINPDKTVFEYTKCVNMKEDGTYDYAEEYETEIKDSEAFKKSLEFLNFTKVVTVEKEREYWICGDIEVALDKVEGLGTFIEAEAKGNFKDHTEARNACEKFLKDLGVLVNENIEIRKGYPQLLLEKN